MITKHFDSIEFSTQKREFKTQTGYFHDKRITVISTGIGPDNIDIVLNELDALVNIDLETRQPKHNLISLNIIRIGTSGAIQEDIPVDSFVLSSFGLDVNGMLHFYQIEGIGNPKIEKAFIEHAEWDVDKARPIIIQNSRFLENYFDSKEFYKGITGTAGGFYGPQGRVLRLPLKHVGLNKRVKSFRFGGLRISNFEMETSVIYGLAKLLGHEALSLNAILANRATGEFSQRPQQVVERLILHALNRIVNI